MLADKATTERPDGFKRVGNKTRLVDRVVEEITAAVIEGRLEAGTHLPPERELAEKLGVSRTVLREAIKILTAKGMLMTRHGAKTVVREITGRQVAEPLRLLVETRNRRQVSFEQLHQVRSIIELAAAALAAAHPSRGEVEGLKRILGEMENSCDDPVVLADKDAGFHRYLISMVKNPLLEAISDTVRELMHNYIVLATPYLDPAKDVLPPHRAVFEAIASADPDRAREAMKRHHDQMLRNHKKFLKAAGEVALKSIDTGDRQPADGFELP